MNSRAFNFYAGPTALPATVLERIQRELFNFQGTGMSIMEISHRAREIEFIIGDTNERIKRLLNLNDQFEVVLLQGGGSLQFSMIPMNFSAPGDPVDYIDTGYWAQKAIREAQKSGRDTEIIASTADRNFTCIPDHRSIHARPKAKYLHLVTNNTVEGTQWHVMPRVSVPLIADMSSDLLTRTFNPAHYDFVYAHAQKNIGIAGVTIVLIRKSLLNVIPDNLPTILDYRTHIQYRSNYHTPPSFAIYVTWLMLQWIEDEMGGLHGLEEINCRKAQLLYDFIDNTNFYQCAVEHGSRSWMNVVFTLPSEELTCEFVNEAKQAGLVGLGGHRSIGGCRASLFNGVTLEAVERLTNFMHNFERSHQPVIVLNGRHQELHRN